MSKPNFVTFLQQCVALKLQFFRIQFIYENLFYDINLSYLLIKKHINNICKFWYKSCGSTFLI